METFWNCMQHTKQNVFQISGVKKTNFIQSLHFPNLALYWLKVIVPLIIFNVYLFIFKLRTSLSLLHIIMSVTLISLMCNGQITMCILLFISNTKRTCTIPYVSTLSKYKFQSLKIPLISPPFNTKASN